MNPPANQAKVNLPACQILMHGLKAEYHRQKLMLKQQKHITDAGMDIYASAVEPELVTHYDGFLTKVCQLKVATSLHLTPPIGTFGMITSRSSTAKNLAGANIRTGIIDAGYTGEIIVIIDISDSNSLSDVLECLKACVRDEVAICQIIFLPAMVVIPKMADEQQLQQIRATMRGDNGFGSTDRK